MDTYQYAMKMEKDGVDYYEGALARTQHPGFQRILKMLIGQEKRHYEVFKALREEGTTADLVAFPLVEVKNIFQQMRDNKDEVELDASEAEVYEKALAIEKKSEDFYRDAATQVAHPNARKQILAIADQEHQHFLLMTDLVKYIERPQEWVESAMFGVREEY
jgi:rubrerythrin